MKILTQTQLNGWLNNLAQRLVLVAPVNMQAANSTAERSGLPPKLLYRQISAAANLAASDQIAWGFPRTAMSPKEWLFPATESILGGELDRMQCTMSPEQGSASRLRTTTLHPPTVLFGIRPCDARGLQAIDALFLRDPADSPYAQHRQTTTIVGLACPQMWDGCFCTAVGGAPDGAAGMDILLTELPPLNPPREAGGTPCKGRGGNYAAQILTDKGAALAADMPGDEQEILLPAPKLTEHLPQLPASAEWKARFEDAFWQRLADRCLGCRICTFVCPTCRCFDVRDEAISGGEPDRRKPGVQVFERLRAWDACTSALYRRAAGGHDPRPTQHHRLRNRFYCKFVYYPDDFGPLGCVGCGRCIEACPVGIDILEIVASLHDARRLDS